jgi:two-component system response regulator DegU
MRLLIVDDNARVRRMIKEVAAPLGAVVFECADGEQALAAYLLHRPDVVLMDIAVGGTDGITAAGRILGADPSARVVMVTDYDGEELREAALAAGTRGYVLKENLIELRGLLDELTRSGPEVS